MENSLLTGMSTESNKFILFELMNTSYGVRSAFVRRLEMVENITPVPNANPTVEGVVLSRGRIIPAVNLRTRFGFPKAPFDLRTRLVIVESEGRTVGLIVDSSREFKTINETDIKLPPEGITNLNGEYLEGIATVDGRLILILELNEILKVGDSVSDESINLSGKDQTDQELRTP
ncbi:MAG TPA: chemotaxis protein CheW [Pyrinomonadaceae bacterium]|nr:chemotaxis protein CheW [Pyrinomonadaceae bacterium]